MSYHDTISALAEDPEQLEQVYHAALKAGETDAFKQAIDDSHAAAPENLLYAAWFHRLKYAAAQAKSFAVAWAWVIPLALLNGLLFWWLSDDQRFMIELVGARREHAYDFMPSVLLWAAPLSAVFVLIYFTAAGHRNWRRSGLFGIVMVAAGAYALWTYPQAGTRSFQEQYLTLMTMHLPLLAVAGVGTFLMAEHRDPANRFAFLIKSLETFIMGGLFVIACSPRSPLACSRPSMLTSRRWCSACSSPEVGA